MSQPVLGPLRFDPIFKSMLWGGRRLPDLLNVAHASDEPIGEAWVLSDVDGHPSRVAEGPFRNATLRELLAEFPERLLGSAPLSNGRFPLLLKFIDARHELSVQVHPNDEQASQKIPCGTGKTEAWVVLDANPKTSRIYAGFQHGIRDHHFRAALTSRTTPETLHSFTPTPGDCVFLEAGTVHAIGADILLFEVQQTSDITYRLYDWDRVDAKTGRPRDLHIDEGLACADFRSGPCHPVRPSQEIRQETHWEKLVSCPYFSLARHSGSRPFRVGAAQQCRVVVVIEGRGVLESHSQHHSLAAGNVYLLPAETGECLCRPEGNLTVLECRLPESSTWKSI